MYQMNSLVMAILIGLIFFLVNEYVPLAPLINLVFNVFMIVVFVTYILQCLGVIRNILPAPTLFK